MYMKRFLIYAKNDRQVPDIRRMAEEAGFQYDEDQPDFVISAGGDGTFLRSERRYPGVPKVLVKESMVCAKCDGETLPDALEHLQSGRMHIVEHAKLEARTADTCSVAVNDAVIRNADPRHALRFRLRVDGEPLDDLLIGDGIVVATPFGSTGYYHAVTGQSIESGLGIAFNNLTVARSPLDVSAGTEVELEIVRTDGQLIVDNHPSITLLEHGDRVTVRLSVEHKARILRHS
jgi:NAD+ kinase